MNLKQRLVSACLAYLVMINFAWSATESPADIATQVSEAEHNAWLKKRFSQQHNQLMPVVAVADMFLIVVLCITTLIMYSQQTQNYS